MKHTRIMVLILSLLLIIIGCTNDNTTSTTSLTTTKDSATTTTIDNNSSSTTSNKEITNTKEDIPTTTTTYNKPTTTQEIITTTQENITTEHIHEYGSWHTTKNPSCTEDGVEERICSCGESETRSIEALGHNYSKWVTVNEPTDTNNGKRERICSRCGHKEEEIIDSLSYIDGLVFELSEDKSYYIVSGKKDYKYEEIVIPTSYNDKPVKKIKESGFYRCNSILSIYISDNVVSIGNNAFYGCSKLKRVDISSIESWLNIRFADLSSNPIAFSKALYLNDELITNLEIPESIETINDYAFYEYSPLISISITHDITSIGEYSFYHCNHLESINMLGNVNIIKISAFYDCSKLKRVDISSLESWCNIDFESSVSNPLYYAQNLYLNGELLTDLTLPSNILSIKQYAFVNCTCLERVNVSSLESWLNLKFANESANPLLSAHNLYINNELCSNIIIPEGIETIEKCLFSGCSIESVVIPTSVTTIKNYAFSNCLLLKNIIIPDSVISIGSHAFFNCKSLDSLGLLSGVKAIGDYAFYGYYSLKNMKIPDAITRIEQYTFYNCASLTSILIPKNITYIGKEAFNVCFRLVEVINKSSLDLTIGSTDNGYVAYYAKEVIDDESKSKQSIISNEYVVYTSEDNVELVSYIGNNTIITIPNGITSIGNYAFYKLPLVSVSIPSNISIIGTHAFYYCSSLKTITIPNSIVSIGNNAFINQSSLSRVNISSIESWLNIDFENRYSNPLCNDCNLYLNDKLITDLIIPNGISTIKDFAFYSFSSLKSVVIPNSITSIEDLAFYNCSSLETIVVPNSIESVGEYAFQNCISLNKVIISSIESWCSIDFCNSTSNPLSYANNLYLNDELVTELVIPGSVSLVNNYAFIGCFSITSVRFLDGVESIGGSAFNGCLNLKRIIMTSSIKKIGSLSFSNCELIDYVVLSNSIEKIESAPFHADIKIYYLGLESQSSSIELLSESMNYDIYFYSEQKPEVSGNYWHYLDESPKIWD